MAAGAKNQNYSIPRMNDHGSIIYKNFKINTDIYIP